jgi:hypothetical protein
MKQVVSVSAGLGRLRLLWLADWRPPVPDAGFSSDFESEFLPRFVSRKGSQCCGRSCAYLNETIQEPRHAE